MPYSRFKPTFVYHVDVLCGKKIGQARDVVVVVVIFKAICFLEDIKTFLPRSAETIIFACI